MKTRIIMAVGLMIAGFFAAIPQAQASVDYRHVACGDSGNVLAVSSWKDNARTVKTYHVSMSAVGMHSGWSRSYSIREIYWSGTAQLGSSHSSTYVEFYRYASKGSAKFNQTSWKGEWQRWGFGGVPLGTTSCTVYA